MKKDKKMNELELIHWESAYKLGVNEIDSQHMDLLNNINDLIEHLTKSPVRGKKSIYEIIVKAGKLATIHFETEENLLSKTKYNEFAEHKNEHEKMTAKITNIISEQKNFKTDTDLLNLVLIFKEWFLSHILLYDKKAEDFFRTGDSI